MKKGKLILACFIIGVLQLCSGCGKEKDETTSVRIAYFPNITHSQALVMKESGSLENKLKDTCNVSWLSFNAGPAEVEAIFAGEVDLGYIGPIPAINANVKSDGDVKIIANACNAGAVLIKSEKSDISSVADLEGKKVAVPQLGNTQHICLLNILKENGLAAKSEGGTVEVVAVENADVQTLLEKGDIDAALVPEPWASILEEKCNAKVLLDYDEIFLNGEYPTTVVVVNNDFYKKHPDIVKTFLEANKEATVYINENKEKAVEIVNKQIKDATGKDNDPAIISKAFQRLVITDNISRDAIFAFGKIGVEQGVISKMPDEELIDTKIQETLH